MDTTPVHTEQQLLLSKEMLNDVADYIKIELGAPIVDVELPDSVIIKCLELALRKISRYNLVVLWYTTVVSDHKIDLSTLPHRVSYVVDVLKSNGDSLTNMTALSSFFGFPAGMKVAKSSYGSPFVSMSDLTSIFAESVIMSRNLNSYKDNMSIDYDYVNNMLYIDPGMSADLTVTLEYVPVLTVDDLYLLARDQTTYDVLLKYATGLCLLSLGRARGKYSTSGNYNYALSSDEMISSGKQYISEIEDELKLNYSHIIMD